jgi:hypothetical protein
MRFAYIDSQGNEVDIPSVEALALRIELGAIGPETQLFDAQSDRWGPARTHEIFQSLARSAGDPVGYVAPPPALGDPDEEEPGLGLDLVPDGAEPPLTVTPPVGAPADEASSDETLSDPADADDELLNLTLVEEEMAFGASATSAPSTEDPPMEGLTADASGDAGLEGLELAPTFPSDPSGSLGSDAPPPLELETPADALDLTGTDRAASALESGGQELLPEAPGPFLGDEPPTWGHGTAASGGDEGPPMDFSRARPASEDVPEAPPSDAAAVPSRRERGGPRARPVPPRRPKRSAFRGLALLVVALGVVAAGSYYGWGLVNRLADYRQGASGSSSLPPVVLPDIPVELVPRMRELGEAALDETVSALRNIPEDLGLPAEPREDWLAGAYLANAGDFPDVEEYWLGIEALVDRARDMEAQLFHDAYVDQLAAAQLVGDTAAMLLERADSGFVATRPERFEAYALMDDLVNATLDLHVFLVERGDSITYEPVRGGVSRDPVLEAVPATSELGQRMWDGVTRITNALDALGTLDRVTTDRLVAVLMERLLQAGFR